MPESSIEKPLFEVVDLEKPDKSFVGTSTDARDTPGRTT